MIVLDTNVLSEVMRGDDADRRVSAWLRGLGEQPVTTVITHAEVLAGLLRLPVGHRRTRLTQALETAMASLGACLPLSADCPAVYAEIVTTRRAAGRPIGTMDALVASIALVNDAGVASRDAGGFDGLGLRLVDPWAA